MVIIQSKQQQQRGNDWRERVEIRTVSRASERQIDIIYCHSCVCGAWCALTGFVSRFMSHLCPRTHTAAAARKEWERSLSDF
jgi:hypothetical protein